MCFPLSPRHYFNVQENATGFHNKSRTHSWVRHAIMHACMNMRMKMDTHNYAYLHISYQDIRQSDCHMLSQKSDA